MSEVAADDLQTALHAAYGWPVQRVDRVPAGTATDNFVVTRTDGGRLFVKVYRHQALDQERAAIGLAEFVRGGDALPVPSVYPSLSGDTLVRFGTRAMSVWQFVEDAETAEGGLSGDRWENVGAVVGRLHVRLQDHPAGRPKPRPATDLRDRRNVVQRYDGLIEAYERRRHLTEFEAWSLDAARQRRKLLPAVDAIVDSLPPLTTQIVHGDLASPNVLLREDVVAALIDFQPPTSQFLSWEIARIACDPRTVMTNDDWQTGLGLLKRAYRLENPSATAADLDAVVAVGCAYTLYSTYPLAEPLHNPDGVTSSLASYAIARHETALTLLATLQGES